MTTTTTLKTRTAAHNRRLAQWRVTWFIEHSTSHQLSWCIDSFALRNPPERKARKRCTQPVYFTARKNSNFYNFIFLIKVSILKYLLIFTLLQT